VAGRPAVLFGGHELAPAVVDPSTGTNPKPASTQPPAPRSWAGRVATIASVALGAVVLVVGIAVATLSPSEAKGEGTVEPTSSSSIAPTPDPTTPSSPQLLSTRPRVTPAPLSTSAPLLTPAPQGVVSDLFPAPSGQPAVRPRSG
jgi:hypothetical protein